MSENETFLFNEYFADPSDKGAPVTIPFNGKDLPFRLRRSLTIHERQRANDAAVAIEIGDDGKPKVTKLDQGAYNVEIVLAGLKEWPFEFSPGRSVPINRKYVEQLDGVLLERIANQILRVGEVQKDALDPFEMKSDEHSSPEGQSDQS